MKSIILFRHGKSDWNADYDKDHDRPLKNRGIKAAKKMGQLLSKKKETPDLIISSTALRTKSTAELAKEAGAWIANIKYDRKIYEGTIDKIISIIQLQNNKHKTICLVGHEPTLSSFIYRINKVIYIKFPTAAMARIDFKVMQWRKIKLHKDQSRINWFIKPKDIN
ncbi:MAG: SixA phosphatase family protein [Candidatus Neomarinimicrobiota bacterium]